jgi:hypothetical protein
LDTRSMNPDAVEMLEAIQTGTVPMYFRFSKLRPSLEGLDPEKHYPTTLHQICPHCPPIPVSSQFHIDSTDYSTRPTEANGAPRPQSCGPVHALARHQLGRYNQYRDDPDDAVVPDIWPCVSYTTSYGIAEKLATKGSMYYDSIHPGGEGQIHAMVPLASAVHGETHLDLGQLTPAFRTQIGKCMGQRSLRQIEGVGVGRFREVIVDRRSIFEGHWLSGSVKYDEIPESLWTQNQYQAHDEEQEQRARDWFGRLLLEPHFGNDTTVYY